jgi:hypothetical protein
LFAAIGASGASLLLPSRRMLAKMAAGREVSAKRLISKDLFQIDLTKIMLSINVAVPPQISGPPGSAARDP